MDWRAFFRGMGSVLDLSGSALRPPRPYRNRPKTDAEAFAADQRAIASDWNTVGEDFVMVMGDLDEASGVLQTHRPGREGASKREEVRDARDSGTFQVRPYED